MPRHPRPAFRNQAHEGIGDGQVELLWHPGLGSDGLQTPRIDRGCINEIMRLQQIKRDLHMLRMVKRTRIHPTRHKRLGQFGDRAGHSSSLNR